jgi:hypothetical protein
MINLPELKSHLRIAASNTNDDAYLTQLEKAAVDFVEKRTGRYWGEVSTDNITEIVYGTGTPHLWMADPPTTIPTSITEQAYPGATQTTITNTDTDGYVLRGTRLVRKGGGVWTQGYEYDVTYTRGYTPGSEPDAIRHAVRMLVAHWYEHRTPLTEANMSTPVPLAIESLMFAHSRLKI